MRFYPVTLLLAAFALAACSTLQENPEPIKGVAYERTSRLLEMRAGLIEKNTAYAAKTGDELKRNTNKRNLAELEDEYARWDKRAQLQVERELARRYQAGDTAAYFQGIEQVAPAAPPKP